MPSPDPSAPHIAAARRRLAHLSGLRARTAAAEARILDAARARLDAVDADLVRLRPRVNTDPHAAERYQALVLERGQLHRVASQSQQVM